MENLAEEMIKGAKVVPCPFCGEKVSHKGTCELSRMRSGQVLVVMAVPVPYADRNQL